MSDIIRRNNEYKLIKLELKSKFHTVDVRNINMELIIYNDMFLEFMTASMLITDSLNLIKRLPIVGGEELVLEFQDQYDNPVVNLSFIVWKVSKQSEFTQSNQMYKLHLVEPRWYESMSQKRYDKIEDVSGNAISKILKSLDTPVTHLAPLYVDDNSPNVEVFSGSSTPYETIRKILYRAHDYNHNPWIFHQTLHENRFESYSKMLTRQTYTEVHLQPTHRENYKRIDRTRIADAWYRSSNQNKVNIDQRGSQNTANITFSLTKKNLHFSDFEYERDFNGIPTLETVPLDRLDTPSKKTRCFISDDPDIAFEANKRTAIYTMLEDNIIHLNISGDTKYASGTILHLDIPSKESFNNGFKTEEDISGRFLITSSMHVIKKDSYRVTMELMKESLSRKL